MNASVYTLHELLPHRFPMLLIDDVLHHEHDRVDTSVEIHAGSAFYDAKHNAVPLWVGIEYMAQTIGVWEGYRKLGAGEKVQSAFLLGVRDFQTAGSHKNGFPVGSKLQVSVVPVIYDEEKRLGVFDCTITAPGIACKARINAFSPLEPQTFIEVLRKNDQPA